MQKKARCETTPEMLKFLTESYEKEAQIRMAWNERHQAELFSQVAAAPRAQAPTGSTEMDVAYATVANGMAVMSRQYAFAASCRLQRPHRDSTHPTIPRMADLRHGHAIQDVGLGSVEEDPRLVKSDTDYTPTPVMRPVDPDTMAILYNTVPEFGRKKYLKLRHGTFPEKKFYFPECVSWDYGWRMRDSKTRRDIKFAYVAAASKGAMCRGGTHPDDPRVKKVGHSDFYKCSQ